MEALAANRLVWWAVLVPPLFFLLLRVVRRPGFFERRVGLATPAALGTVRLLVAGVLLADVLIEDLSSTAILPRALIESMGVLRFLYAAPVGFAAFLLDARALGVFKVVTAILLLAATLGAWTRLTVPLAALAYLVFAGILRQYSAFYHAGLVPLYVLGVLALTPCGDGCSLDRFRRRGRGLPVDDRPAPVYGWSRYACWTVVALCYVAAGLSKLRNGGLGWWDPTNLRGIYYKTTLNPMHSDWRLSLELVAVPDVVVQLLGAASVALEIGFIAVLFSRTARRVLPPAMAGFHLLVWFLQNLLFLDLVVLQAIFYDRPVATPGSVETAPRRRGSPALVAGTAAVVLAAWVARVEFYPLTAMQMFSWADRSGAIEFYRVLAHHRSGVLDVAPLRSCAYRTFAITPVVKKAFDPAQREICAEYLATCAARYNRRAADGVDRFDLEKWRWDLRADPTGAHASLLARYSQDVS
jgi:hypothetical protein